MSWKCIHCEKEILDGNAIECYDRSYGENAYIHEECIKEASSYIYINALYVNCLQRKLKLLDEDTRKKMKIQYEKIDNLEFE